MTAEEWRPIVGASDYTVSSFGRVVSYKRKRPRELFGAPNVDGYQMIFLSIDGQQVQRPLHRLVAEAFIGPPGPGMEIRHLDGDNQNNRLSNLSWGTRSDNMQDRLRHGNHPMKNKTQCVHGHAYTAENTYSFGNNWRACRECRRANSRAYRERRAFRAANVPLAS